MKVLKMPAVEEKTGLKKGAIFKAAANGIFPKQIKLGNSAAGWIESEVDAWIAEQIAIRDAEKEAKNG